MWRMRGLSPFVALWFLAACSGEPDDPRAGRAEQPIVGGVEDELHDYTVAVGDEFQPFCSGTLVSPQTVITAAHCALGITTVWFGKHATAFAPADAEIIHPDYIGDDQSPDVAVVRIAAPVHVQSAPLLRRTLTNTPEFIGPPWTVVGYGIDDVFAMTGFGLRRLTAIPLAAIGPTTTLDDRQVSDKFVYYETMGSSACYGDSGGSTFFIADGVEHQAAVVAWGAEFCDAFGVHTRVDQPMLDSFVQPHIDAFEAGSSCQNDGACDEGCTVDAQVFDPDCEEFHCMADGICARACVAPADPDCAGMAVDHCRADGICEPGCAEPDADCEPSPAVSVTTTTSTATVTSTTATSVTSTSVSSSTTTGAGGSDSPKPNDADTRLYARACGCGVPAGNGYSGAAVALLGVVVWGARRRQRRQSLRILR
jgi:hypothetical protein